MYRIFLARSPDSGKPGLLRSELAEAGLEGVEHAARLPGGDLVAEGWRLVRGEAGRFSNSWSILDFKRYGKVPQSAAR